MQVRHRGSQPVVRIGSARWSTVCTPGHRWLTQQAYPKNRSFVEWGDVKAESAFTAWNSKASPKGVAGARRLVLTGYAEGGKSLCTPDEARMLAWLLGDGHIPPSRNGGSAYIAQAEKKHAAEIRGLVTRTGALTSEVTQVSGHGRVVCKFRLKSAYVRSLLAYIEEGLLSFVLSLSQEARSAWLDAWRKAEGSSGNIYQNPGERQEAIALTAFLEGYLPQRISGRRHHGISLKTTSVGNGPQNVPVYEDAGTEDVWCPTTGLGSWTARDKDGRIFLTGNCCSLSDTQGLWWNANWTYATFLACWQEVATAFGSNPLVVGYDIKNEPRQATISGHVYNPTWGDGSTQTDFRWLYEQIGNAVLAIDPAVLIFCEGINSSGDLTGVASHPVTLNVADRVVYSVHDYPQGWSPSESQAAYLASQQASAGYILSDGIAPLWIGEFGVANDTIDALRTPAQGHGSGLGAGPVSRSYGNWWRNFLAWHAQADPDWCCWHLSGTHRQGTTPSTNQLQYAEGDRTWNGLYAQDWNGPANPAVIEALQAIMAPTMGPGVS
jgi:hypothetical protein